MRTITIANQKGGCGKTTVAINLAASLSKEARRVLLIDLDPQAHCALGMAVPEEQIDLSIHECLMGRLGGTRVELSQITWKIAANLDLVPSKANLTALEPHLGDRQDVDGLLRDILREQDKNYEYCVVDCPPHLGVLMRNGLRAADEIVIPVDTGYFSLHGLTNQLTTIEQLCDRNGSKTRVRILPNQYDVRTKLAREILAELRNRFKGLVFETIVNFNTKLKEGASFGQPITEFAPSSMGAKDFERLAREIIAGEVPRTATPEMLQHVERLAKDAERLLATTATLVDPRRMPSLTRPPMTGISPPADVPSAPLLVESPSANRAASRAAASRPNATLSRAPMPAAPRPTVAPPVAVRPAAATPPAPAPMVALPVTALVANAPVAPVMLASTFPNAAESTGRTTAAPLSSSAEFHAGIDRKIGAIYGVRQDGDVAIFRSRFPEATEIQIAGDFNDWMPHTTPMRRLPDGDFEVRLKLPKGKYRYRLVVDGRWSHDVFNPTIETNEYGELNSVVEIKQ